jgi:uncharacterized protein
MEIYNKLREFLSEEAEAVKTAHMFLGLGYSAVELEDGRLGLAYTYLTGKKGCTLFQDCRDFEGAPAAELLELLSSENLIERSAAVAAVNALNQNRAGTFEEDRDSLLEDLGVKAGDSVAMAGYFAPIAAKIKKLGAEVRANDYGKEIGDTEDFMRFIESGAARGLILTSTSVINGSTEELLCRLHPSTPCAMIGPTTPMIPEAFAHLPIHFLGGLVPRDKPDVLKAVRTGRGTPAIMRFSQKVYYRRTAAV